MATSKYRGHEIYALDGEWYYCDIDELVSEDVWRACGQCEKDTTADGHDGCLGTLPGVMNACCGHGKENEAYVMFENKETIRGEEARQWIDANQGAASSAPTKQSDFIRVIRGERK